jgi:hypothetical protein
VSGLAFVTDGSAAAAALAKWLGGSGMLRIEARSGADVARIVAARSAAGMTERTVAVSDRAVPDADFSADAALAIVRGWLADLPPIEIRTRGDQHIRARLQEERPGAEALVELRTALGPSARGTLPAKGRGRPVGSDPFRGAGFDVCVALLLDCGKALTERELARTLGRSPYGVHRVLVELERRRFVERARAGTRVREPLLLRDALAEAWQERVQPPRAARGFLARRPARVRADLLHALARSGERGLLAGPSAVIGPAASATRQTFVYWDGDDALLARVELEPTRAAGPDVVIWPILERGIAYAPRRLGSALATNRVVAFLDLAALGTDRDRRAAEAVWSEGAGT